MVENSLVMKKITILLFLIFSFQNVDAQQLEVGMEFHYKITPFLWHIFPEYFDTIFISDKIQIDTKDAFVFNDIDSCNKEKPILYLFQDGEKMFYQQDSVSHLLYDFSLSAGDTLKIKHPFSEVSTIGASSTPIDSSFFRIGSTGFLEQNGKTIPFQNTWFADNENSFPADIWQIYKGLGGTQYFFPTHGLCEIGRCLSKVKYPDGSEIIFENCQLSSIKNLIQEEIKIFPNPVDDFLELSKLPDFQKILIYNNIGRLVKVHDKLISKIDCSELQKGFYSLVVVLKDNQKIATKFIKK